MIESAPAPMTEVGKCRTNIVSFVITDPNTNYLTDAGSIFIVQ